MHANPLELQMMCQNFVKIIHICGVQILFLVPTWYTLKRINILILKSVKGFPSSYMKQNITYSICIQVATDWIPKLL